MSDAAGWILLVGRILFPAIFLNSVAFHSVQGQMAIGYARQVQFPVPALAGWPSAVVLVAGSASIVLGAWADLGAVLLGAFVLVAALGFHRFWEITDPEQRRTQRGNLWRNVSLLGGCLVLFALFAAFGHDLPLTLTDPLIDLR